MKITSFAGIVNGQGVRTLPARSSRAAPDSVQDSDEDDDDEEEEEEEDDDDEDSSSRFAPGRSSRPIRAAARAAKRKRGDDGDSEDSYRPGSRRRAAANRTTRTRGLSDSDASDGAHSRRKKRRPNYGELSDDSSSRSRRRTSLRTRGQAAPQIHDEDVEEEVVCAKPGSSRTALLESHSESSSSSDNGDENESEMSDQSETEGSVDLNAIPPKPHRTLRSNPVEETKRPRRKIRDESSEEETVEEYPRRPSRRVSLDGSSDEEVEEYPKRPTRRNNLRESSEEEQGESAVEEEDPLEPRTRTVRKKYSNGSSGGESEDTQWSPRRQVNGRRTARAPKSRVLENGSGSRAAAAAVAARRRRAPAPNYAEESDDDSRLPTVVSVSSRGRIRKVTEKVRALLRY